MSKTQKPGATKLAENHLYEEFVRLIAAFPKGGGNFPPSFAWPPRHSSRDNSSRLGNTDSQVIPHATKYLAHGGVQTVPPLAALTGLPARGRELIAVGACP